MPEIWPNWMYVKASPCQWFDFDPIECLSFVSKQDLASDVWCAIQSTPSSVHCPSSMNNEMFVNRQECRSTCNHARMPVMCQWWFDPRIICPSMTSKKCASDFWPLNTTCVVVRRKKEDSTKAGMITRRMMIWIWMFQMNVLAASPPTTRWYKMLKEEQEAGEWTYADKMMRTSWWLM